MNGLAVGEVKESPEAEAIRLKLRHLKFGTFEQR